MTGKLISFEGIDGSGKTTVIQKVAHLLKNRGQRVIVLQEPGTTEIGKAIRALLKSNKKRSVLTDLLLYEASRASLVEMELEPALSNHDFVLIDRYIDSTVAYQSYGGGLPLDIVQNLNAVAINGYTPDNRFLIDVDLETARQRREQREQTSDSRDPFDTETQFAKRVYDGYQDMVKQGVLTPVDNQDSELAARQIIDMIVD
jgi:dTMP kinase